MFLIFSWLLMASSALSLERQECVPVSFDLGPLREQGDSEWGWAMVAADLMGHGNGITPKRQFSAAELVHSCAGFEAEKTPKSLSLIQGRTFGKLFAQQKGKPALRVSASSLAGAYCLAQRGYACLESEVSTEKFIGTGKAWGSEELSAELKAACQTKVYLHETRAPFERFRPGEKSRSAAVVAGWLKDGAPVAVAMKDHEAIAVAMRWNEKTGQCEFQLRHSQGHRPLWIGEGELRRQASHATRILTRPIVIPPAGTK
jgi:hypothetical protein